MNIGCSIFGSSWSWSYGNWIYNYLVYAIGTYHHLFCEVQSCLWRGVQHHVIKFVSDVWQVVGFLLPDTPVFFTNETYNHDITEILLKVALNNIKPTNNQLTLNNNQSIIQSTSMKNEQNGH